MADVNMGRGRENSGIRGGVSFFPLPACLSRSRALKFPLPRPLSHLTPATRANRKCTLQFAGWSESGVICGKRALNCNELLICKVFTFYIFLLVLQTAALRAVGNIVTGTDEQTQVSKVHVTLYLTKLTTVVLESF